MISKTEREAMRVRLCEATPLSMKVDERGQEVFAMFPSDFWGEARKDTDTLLTALDEAIELVRHLAEHVKAADHREELPPCIQLQRVTDFLAQADKET